MPKILLKLKALFTEMLIFGSGRVDFAKFTRSLPTDRYGKSWQTQLLI